MPSFVSRSILLLFILLCIDSGSVIGQHKAWRQYTVADGLPGNQVYDMLQDSKGHMWFVTDKGICRFNGYEFVTPVDTSSWVGTEAFIPVEDDKGRIWFNRMNQSLWFIENDSVKEWEYNHVLDLYRDGFKIIDQLGFAEDGSTWIGLPGMGFLIVDNTGHYRTINQAESPRLTFAYLNKRLIHTIQHPQIMDGNIKGGNAAIIVKIIDGKEVRLDSSDSANGNLSYWGAWKFRNDTVLTLFNGVYSVFHLSNKLFELKSKVFAEKAIQTPEGEILLASYTSPASGLFKYATLEDFENGIGENVLPDYLVTDVYIDHEGGWWASTKNGGVLYCKNPGISVFDNSSGLSSSNVLCLTSDGKEMVYAGLDNKNVISVHRHSKKINVLPVPLLEDDMMALFYERGHHRLWCSAHLKFWNGAKWNVVTKLNGDNKPATVNAKHISVSLSGDRFWMSSSHGLYGITTNTLSVAHFKDSTQHSSSNRTYAVAEDANGTVWVATMQGLKILEEGNYMDPPFVHHFFKAGIRDVAVLQDGMIAFGAPGKGIAILYPDGQLMELSKEDGLSSNDITMLKAGSEGELYVCTSSGLNRLTAIDRHQWKIQNIGIKQGLPSNMVNDLAILRDEMWIGTDKGLVSMKDMPETYPVAAPIIVQLDVDNQKVPDIDNIRLPYDKNNITIHFYSLHFRSDGDILYRYRLSEADTIYNFTRRREVTYAKLAPGKYTFEVQAQQEDRSWSKPAIVFFEIAYPWWVRWWFITLVVVLVLGMAALIIKTRLKVYRRTADMDLKMKDLEMAALRAQINPHFIFNCLGSIQQFIVENDSASATRYLARFAKLVRLALHSSIDGKHSMADEIAMLDNYLALEQMRFKGRFQYQIDTDGIGDADEMHIPPMLLQPFVENAVKHGIGQTEGEGEIKIAFTRKENRLLAVITDNGPGFSAKVAESSEPHKSVGLSLTRSRLDLISGSLEGSSYTQVNITGRTGEVKGARVEIWIPLD